MADGSTGSNRSAPAASVRIAVMRKPDFAAVADGVVGVVGVVDAVGVIVDVDVRPMVVIVAAPAGLGAAVNKGLSLVDGPAPGALLEVTLVDGADETVVRGVAVVRTTVDGGAPGGPATARKRMLVGVVGPAAKPWGLDGGADLRAVAGGRVKTVEVVWARTGCAAPPITTATTTAIAGATPATSHRPVPRPDRTAVQATGTRAG